MPGPSSVFTKCLLNIRKNVNLGDDRVQVRHVGGNLSTWFAGNTFFGMFEKKYFGDKVPPYSMCSVVTNLIEVN